MFRKAFALRTDRFKRYNMKQTLWFHANTVYKLHVYPLDPFSDLNLSPVKALLMSWSAPAWYCELQRSKSSNPSGALMYSPSSTEKRNKMAGEGGRCWSLSFADDSVGLSIIHKFMGQQPGLAIIWHVYLLHLLVPWNMFDPHEITISQLPWRMRRTLGNPTPTCSVVPKFVTTSQVLRSEVFKGLPRSSKVAKVETRKSTRMSVLPFLSVGLMNMCFAWLQHVARSQDHHAFIRNTSGEEFIPFRNANTASVYVLKFYALLFACTLWFFDYIYILWLVISVSIEQRTEHQNPQKKQPPPHHLDKSTTRAPSRPLMSNELCS